MRRRVSAGFRIFLRGVFCRDGRGRYEEERMNMKKFGVDPKRLLGRIVYLVRWMVCAVAVGAVIGVIITGFYYALRVATSVRTAHPQIIWLLPAG